MTFSEIIRKICRRSSVVLLLIWALVFLPVIDAQYPRHRNERPDRSEKESKPAEPPVTTDKIDKVNPEMTGWQFLLEQMTDEARSLPLVSRPYALADIAEAFCEMGDRTRSVEAYRFALEALQTNKSASRMIASKDDGLSQRP